MNVDDTVLITGITGFLGRHLAKRLVGKCNIIGISHSEQRILCFRNCFPSIKIYRCDIADVVALERIISDNKVNKIIHCAAMKNMWICQNNVTECVNTNIIGSQNLVKLAKKYGIIDMVAVSTDKANNPTCVYGMSKHIMEKMVLENGYRIFQGVNFMWSDGSVLEFWCKTMRKGEPLMVYSNVVRYFCDVNEICEKIVTSKDKIITTDKNYRISIDGLLRAFCKAFDYHNYKVEIREFSYEKQEEELITSLYTEPSEDEMADILKSTFPETILYI